MREEDQWQEATYSGRHHGLADACGGSSSRGGGLLVLASLFGLYPQRSCLGCQWKSSSARTPPRASRSCPDAWVVERTLAWLNRCRRLAKDFENLSRNALAFIRPASIRLMLRKTLQSSLNFRTDSNFSETPQSLRVLNDVQLCF